MSKELNILANFFKKRAQNNSNLVSIKKYVEDGLLDMNKIIPSNKPAKKGFTAGGYPYPKNYNGGYNPDNSGLPKPFDDDISIESGMTALEIQYWTWSYFNQTDFGKLKVDANKYIRFPTAKQILESKAKYIQEHTM